MLKFVLHWEIQNSCMKGFTSKLPRKLENKTFICHVLDCTSSFSVTLYIFFTFGGTDTLLETLWISTLRRLDLLIMLFLSGRMDVCNVTEYFFASPYLLFGLL